MLSEDYVSYDLLMIFTRAQGITPVLPLFREAILNGAPEVKEQAAQGLGEVIRLTSAEALQPSVVHITGPLIRILGDRLAIGSFKILASNSDSLILFSSDENSFNNKSLNQKPKHSPIIYKSHCYKRLL